MMKLSPHAPTGPERSVENSRAVVYRLLLGLCMALALGIYWLTAGAAVTQAQATPRFDASTCDDVTASTVVVADDVRCGYVVVPERRPHVTGGVAPGNSETVTDTIRLAVMVLPATGEQPVDDPLFVAQGGPGGSTIEIFADLLADSAFREQRDIVLFDQRGTLFSEPNLICTEMFTRMDELNMASDEEYPELLDAVTLECRTRLVEEGVDIAAYNSLENAADVDDIRRALGYDNINFYGVSYGTLLGFHLMRDYPDHLRSVLFDGVVPPQINFITEAAASEERVFSAFFAACAADERCTAQYGDLEARFFALVDQLNEFPVDMRVLHPDTGETLWYAFFGDDLIDFFFQMFYWGGSPAILPKVLADAEAWRFDYIGAILAGITFDETFSDGMYNSVICAEDVDFVPGEAALDGVRSDFSNGFADELAEYLATCDVWQVPAFDAFIDAPVVSDIPALLLSGAFDPITPPPFAAAAAATLANSHEVVLANGGHGIAFGMDECVDGIIQAFLTEPAQKPDDTCLPSRPAFDYVAPDAVVVPLLTYVNSLNGTALQRLGWMGIALAIVFSAFVVWPAGWFVRNLRGDALPLTDEEIRLRRRDRMLVLSFAFVTAAFLMLFGLTVVLATFGDENLLMLGAVPGSMRWIFWLTWVMAGLAVVIALVALSMWIRRRGPLTSRLYYSLLAVAELVFVRLLAVEGFLGLVFP